MEVRYIKYHVCELRVRDLMNEETSQLRKKKPAKNSTQNLNLGYRSYERNLRSD